MIAWSKRSIFFDLPYWKDLPIRHNLDVMHIKTYKQYVVNQTYPEGSIYACYLINEAMLYAMNYMPDGTKKSHKQGSLEWMDKEGEVAYPNDKNGKVYILENVQYQHARKWVLKHSTENVEMVQ
ncbi:hypothetical protein AAC387_Pa10g0287 [Persea americana]